MANVRRIIRDLKMLMEPERKTEGIFIKTVDEMVDMIYMMLIGPKDTPYEGCFFFFTIDPTMQYNSKEVGQANVQYPYNPPKVLFYSYYSVRCHPNLYQPSHSGGGKVCLSILGTWAGEPWGPCMNFLTIAQTILSILDTEPLRNEPGFNSGRDVRVKKYTELIQYVCLKESLEHVVLQSFTDDPANKFVKLFSEEIRDYYLNNKENYVNIITKRAVEFDGKQITSSPYGCGYEGVFNYESLLGKII